MLGCSAAGGLRHEEEHVLRRIGAVRIGLAQMDPAETKVQDLNQRAVPHDAAPVALLIDVEHVVPRHVAEVRLKTQDHLAGIRKILCHEVEGLVRDVYLVLKAIEAVERAVINDRLRADGLLQSRDSDTNPSIALVVGDARDVHVFDANRNGVCVSLQLSARSAIAAILIGQARDVLGLLNDRAIRTLAGRVVATGDYEAAEKGTENQCGDQAANAHRIPRRSESDTLSTTGQSRRKQSYQTHPLSQHYKKP
jgi:hypothetical protein